MQNGPKCKSDPKFGPFQAICKKKWSLAGFFFFCVRWPFGRSVWKKLKSQNLTAPKTLQNGQHFWEAAIGIFTAFEAVHIKHCIANRHFYCFWSCFTKENVLITFQEHLWLFEKITKPFPCGDKWTGLKCDDIGSEKSQWCEQKLKAYMSATSPLFWFRRKKAEQSEQLGN